MRRGFLLLGEDLETPAPDLAPGISIQLFLNDLVGPVLLAGIENMPADRSGDEVGELKAGDIGGLGHEAGLERERAAVEVATLADAPELALQLLILPGASPFENHRSP